VNDDRVQLDISASIARITLNRPEKLNAIDPVMLARLEAAIAMVEAAYDVRVVVITGAGDRAFSVGADINAWSAQEPVEYAMAGTY
jgi:enoyl-CoA hydratase